MTVNTKFEAYKLQRELKRSGVELQFYRSVDNEFGEPTEAETEVGSICCLYHEQNSQISVTTGETTQTRSKKISCLLCSLESVESLDLRVGDFVFWNEKKYEVSGWIDLQNWGIIADVTLEVIDDGDVSV